MADYCKQCSVRYFGKDEKDLAGLISESEVKQGLGAVVICEGCGFVLVNHLGECLGGEACCESHEPPRNS
jgi:hypothetical protein